MSITGQPGGTGEKIIFLCI